jgi:hypothetical protein
MSNVVNRTKVFRPNTKTVCTVGRQYEFGLILGALYTETQTALLYSITPTNFYSQYWTHIQTCPT